MTRPALVIAAACVLTPAVSPAQQTGGPDPSATAPASESQRAVAPASVYKQEVCADRMSVRVADDGETSEAVVTVRTHPAGSALIEFGALRAYLERGRVVVTRDDDRTAAFVQVRPGARASELARDLLETTPAIQLALAFDADPWAAPVWPIPEDATVEFVSPSEAVGRTADATTVVRFDPETGRLRSLEVRWRDGERTVRIDSEPVDPGTPSAWRTETEDRRVVRALGDLLAPSGEGGRILAGDPAPDLLLFGLDARPWQLRSRESGPVVLILARAATYGAFAGYAAALDVADGEDAPPALDVFPAVCTEPFEESPAAFLKELRTRWGPYVRWTVSPETTIDRFAPDKAAVAVVVDALDTVRAIIPLDGRSEQREAIREQIEAALSLD